MKNVLLVFGGVSYEHDISVITASQIYNKTKIENVNLVPFYVSREGEFFVYENKKFVLSDFSKSNFSPSSKKFKQVTLIPGERNVVFVKSVFGLKELLKSEVAIFACHGGDGENGKLVSLFESVDIFCSAGSVDGLSICMDKFLFKQVMKGLKIPTVSGLKISEFEFENQRENVLRAVKRLKFPVIVKQNSGGSSIGIFTSKSEEEFEQNIKAAFEFDGEVLVEKFINNFREFNVAVLGDSENFEVSEIDEPLKVHEVLSFEDKYLLGGKGSKGGTKKLKPSGAMENQKRRFPADLDETVALKIKGYAKKIFAGLGLCGVVRIDFLLDNDTGKVYVCEVNAIPGSLAYYFFCNNSLLLNKLTKRLIEVAEHKKEQKKSLNPDFYTSIL